MIDRDMLDAEFTVYLKDGVLMIPIQSEVENIALTTVGNHHGIYFDEIPLNDNLYLKFDREINTWIIYKREDK